MSKSIAVLGLGKYGISLAKSMYEMGADVMVVDNNREKLNEISDKVTSAVRADLSVEEEVEALALRNLDVVVVAMATNLVASIMSVAVAKEQGVPVIVAKSSSDMMSSILKKVGADKVIFPEEYSGVQSARILTSDSFLDYFQVDENLCMVEIRPRKEWIGKNLIDMNFRKKYNANVIAEKINDHWVTADPHKALTEDEELLVVLEKSALGKLETS